MSPDGFHQARWREPLLDELACEGHRGVVPPRAAAAVDEAAGDVLARVPDGRRRSARPALPELSQAVVLRHFLRLSQETLGAAVGIDIGQGTATVKYNPPVNDRLLREARIDDLHPLAGDAALRGVLEVLLRLEAALCEVSGLARFSFQPGGGTHGIYANALIIRRYHEARGSTERDEILTTLYSHPSDAAAPATAGFRVTTLYPGERGYADLEAVRAAVGPRTAGLMLANPEDTGIFNPEIAEITRLVHDAGGICAYDQANANGLLGVTRAAEAGFDLCQFNLHKTFGSPHWSGGQACGAIGASEALAPYLPPGLVVRDADGTPHLEDARASAAPPVRAFLGMIPAAIRAYAWIAALGPAGLRAVAETAVLNNNYLAARLREVPGVEPSYAATNPHPRLEQIRYSLAGVTEATGVDTEAIARRTIDHGVTGYFPSHHPWTVPEPMTLEPTESPTRADLDAYADAVAAVVAEAASDPERVHAAPERGSIHRTDASWLDDPERWALTWRAYRRKHGAAAPPAGEAATAG